MEKTNVGSALSLGELKKQVSADSEVAALYTDALLIKKQEQRQALRDVAVAAAKLAMDVSETKGEFVTMNVLDLQRLCESLVVLNQIDAELDSVDEMDE
ncbi:hypothetical protein GTO89_10615 [Heliobacterium gestii]|uniref:Uncharacterized protein n=1 Tax=Heliomicrobium gestii TaxID=2699 RepID=A0A845LD59_HELGE|nr:hypothetical protein [Heliomicrobium gestii]MBM7867094.1 hypothetical protein [Heliomicrobium gestii]MZP43491.1 hypothetical protein [Heliomicrobium gestii]